MGPQRLDEDWCDHLQMSGGQLADKTLESERRG